ncbi:unnamed protein product [Symbiodinium natans]|uniref:Uncharacterized protein n=1 Tax=Symbiodinium natans TaxID=878477 RepID=A0A812Q4H6_9DINO|nr:unnamed protein product [Symbiodinium natans]
MDVEGENGPVFLSAAPSGGSLGGSFWCLEALGVRMAVIGTACAASVPVAQGLDTEALSKAELVVCLCLAHDGDIEIRASLPQVSQEASAALGRGGNVLVPIGPDQAFTEDLVMSLARQIAKLSDKCQGPIFACGAPALRLRRCGVFAEFASKTCLDRAHSGEHPFLVDALCESGRLVLAETVSELAELYQEPCMVLASQATAQDFDGRWAKNPESRILRSDAPLAGCQLRCLGQPFRRRLLGSEIRRLTSSRLLVARGAAELLESSSRLKAQSAPLVLPPAEFVNVPLDLSLARVQCWLPEDQMARIEKGKRPADSMLELLEGAFVGRRRPRISGLMPCSTSGAMRREAVRLGLEAKGLEVAAGEGADGQKTELLVPSLNARIILNQPVSDDPNAIESIVECVSVEGRRQILEVLNAELQQ